MKKLLLLLLLIPSIALGTPSASSTSGTWSHGTTGVTITGTDFGTKSPAAPLWWDDMEGHTVNVHSSAVFGSDDLSGVISSLPTNSKHYTAAMPTPAITEETYRIDEAMMKFRASGWDSALETTGNGVDGPHDHSDKYAAGCHYEFSALDYEPGDGSASEPLFRDDPTYNLHYDNVGLTVSKSSTFSTFVAYWYYRLDPATIHEDDAGGDDLRVNGKFLNIEQGYEAYNSGMYAGGSFLYRSWETRPEEESSGDTVDMNEGSFSCSSYTGEYMTNPYHNWIHITHIGDDTTNIEQVFEGGELVAGGTGCTSYAASYGYTYGGFHGYCNLTSTPGCTSINTSWFGCKDCYRYFDDLYLDDTFSRVELCNNATHSSATICEPQIPSAWGTTEITVQVNQGSLPNGTAYLFVYKSDNTVNATGYSVTLEDASPATIRGLSIN